MWYFNRWLPREEYYVPSKRLVAEVISEDGFEYIYGQGQDRRKARQALVNVFNYWNHHE